MSIYSSHRTKLRSLKVVIQEIRQTGFIQEQKPNPEEWVLTTHPHDALFP